MLMISFVVVSGCCSLVLVSAATVFFCERSDYC